VWGHPNVHGTFVSKNSTVTHSTSKQNHFTYITSVHSTSLHFTSLHVFHSTPTSIPLFVTTFLHVTTYSNTIIKYNTEHGPHKNVSVCKAGVCKCGAAKCCMVAPNICGVLSMQLAICRTFRCKSFVVVPRLMEKLVHLCLTVHCAVFLAFSPEI